VVVLRKGNQLELNIRNKGFQWTIKNYDGEPYAVRVARMVREQAFDRKVGCQVSSLMIGSPDMAFESNLVDMKHKIKRQKWVLFKTLISKRGVRYLLVYEQKQVEKGYT
jgi:hypothetical protein